MTPDFTRPRLIFVTRKTPLELLIERLGTYSQAKFYLESRGQRIADQEAAHERVDAGFRGVLRAVPADQRRVHIDREQLDRFLFAPDDVVVAVGQDGLVPNVAKYLRGQLTIGINPDPARNDGILCPHGPADTPALLEWIGTRGPAYRVQPRTMALAQREDGQTLRALNEIFIGHRSHQSARYTLVAGGKSERHSSSGVICASGTGCTGWVRSIAGQRSMQSPLLAPEDPRLAWFVREPFPSVNTGVTLDFGMIEPPGELRLVSQMGEGGVLFADGIESDWVEFLDGQTVVVRRDPELLKLVVKGEAAPRT